MSSSSESTAPKVEKPPQRTLTEDDVVVVRRAPTRPMAREVGNAGQHRHSEPPTDADGS